MLHLNSQHQMRRLVIFGLGMTAMVSFALMLIPNALFVFDLDRLMMLWSLHHFATKTAYWQQERQSIRTSRLDHMHLVQTQFVTRHGIRYPTLDNMNKIQSLINKLQDVSTTSTLPSWLKSYELPYNASVEGELAERGRDEMRQYALRQLQSSPIKSSTKKTYSPQYFRLTHTAVSRTKDSAITFARTFFLNPDDVQYVTKPKHNDSLLRFFDCCPLYHHRVKQNISAVAEMILYKHSRRMKYIKVELAQALGLTHVDATKLTFNDVASVFDACAFDIALYRIKGHWCSLLSREYIESLEFYNDLHEFYLIGGGYPINYEMAGLLLQDILTTMEHRIHGRSKIMGDFRFAHAETTLPLMTLLGFGSKTPLRAHDSWSTIVNREFRTATLAPFAANIEFRLYKHKSSYFVQIRVNERDDVVIPGCDHVYCPFKHFKMMWHRFLYDYDFEKHCKG